MAHCVAPRGAGGGPRGRGGGCARRGPAPTAPRRDRSPAPPQNGAIHLRALQQGIGGAAVFSIKGGRFTHAGVVRVLLPLSGMRFFSGGADAKGGLWAIEPPE